MDKNCKKCGIQSDRFVLCSSCIISHFQDELTWTSKNQELDTFIKYTHIMASNPNKAACWAKWEEFTNIEKASKETLDELVVLKTVGNQSNLSNIMNEAAALFHCYNQKTSCFTVKGFTQDPINMQYYIITTYAECGDLRRYMRENPTLSLRDKIFIIWDISVDLERIHEDGLVHRDIHAGNILYTRNVGHFRREVPIHLMKSCWHENPLQRPTAKEIKDKVSDWCLYADEEKIQQMTEAEERQIISHTPFDGRENSSEAIYTSRLLPLVVSSIHTEAEARQITSHEEEEENPEAIYANGSVPLVLTVEEPPIHKIEED
ncbi:776_t:CDS:2 [Dentiscutata erythropus]|uniref:776_t:CDS:1 n=1 Tax=Dentiscutata erythropus TaxID=1348616 RepID=A0A9N9HC49_9GLOM|nr:776_t:CDS:2 [Dentiscutata erythropus]